MKHFSEISPTAEKVVDAAEGLIQARGYNGFSYDDVAKLVGIKKPSIHHHFATKSELAAVIAQRYTHRFREMLLQIEGRHVKAIDRLNAYASLFETTFKNDKHLCVCGMLGAESGSLPDIVNLEVANFFRINMDWLTQVFRDGQSAGQLTLNVAPEGLAEGYLSLLEGAMVVRRTMNESSGPVSTAVHFLKALETPTSH